MWLIFALITFMAWGTADLFYKSGNVENERYSHLKTSIMVGLVMGVAAIGILIFGDVGYYNPINLLIYLPVSLMYILSMTVGYFGLRYLELSVSSPIQNASGAVSCLIMMAVLRELPSLLEGIAIVVITFGVVMLGVFEKKKENEYIAEHNRKYKIGFVAFMMPILYCIIDSLGTALDGIYLDDITSTPLRNVTEATLENVANVSYMLTFFIVAVVLAIYVYGIKKAQFTIKGQKNRTAAATMETIGQFTYAFAMSGNGMVAAPLIASYCVMSVLLARIFLKEKLSAKQYLMITCVFVGILILGIVEGLSE
ncbi:MAG: hypothetical protein Q4B31_00650 [Clostridia bacterium]|nr:hypothetical protein [Clostridia bacterium]